MESLLDVQTSGSWIMSVLRWCLQTPLGRWCEQVYVSERRWQRLQNALHDKQTPREKMLTLLKTSDDFEHEVLGCRLIHFDEPRLDIFLGDDRRLYMVGTIGQRHFPLVRRHHIEQLSDEQFTRVLTSIGSA